MVLPAVRIILFTTVLSATFSMVDFSSLVDFLDVVVEEDVVLGPMVFDENYL